jgi:hypothetical protein
MANNRAMPVADKIVLVTSTAFILLFLAGVKLL